MYEISDPILSRFILACNKFPLLSLSLFPSRQHMICDPAMCIGKISYHWSQGSPLSCSMVMDLSMLFRQLQNIELGKLSANTILAHLWHLSYSNQILYDMKTLMMKGMILH